MNPSFNQSLTKNFLYKKKFVNFSFALKKKIKILEISTGLCVIFEIKSKEKNEGDE